MLKNESVKCDVKKCRHNVKGANCCLEKVKITCGSGKDTCCGDFSEK